MRDQTITSPLCRTRTREKKAGKYYCPRDIRIYDSIVRTAWRSLLVFMASENGEKFFWAVLRLMMFQCNPKRAYISWHLLNTYRLRSVRLRQTKRRYKTAERNRRSYGRGVVLAQNWCNNIVSRAQCHRGKGTRRTDFILHSRKAELIVFNSFPVEDYWTDESLDFKWYKQKPVQVDCHICG
jgi:hypothetical protein